MRRIIELVRACSPYAVGKVLGKESGSDASLTLRLYKLLREGYPDEDLIARRLYGESADHLTPAYRALKARLSNILIEIVLEDKVRTPSYRTYDDAYEHGHRQLEVAHILVSRKLYTSAREIASQAFRRVKDFEIITLNLGLTDILSSLHLGVSYNEGLFRKYHDLYVIYSEIAHKQSIVVDHYREIRNHIYATRMSPVEIGELASEFSAADRPIKQAYPTIPVIQSMYIQTELAGLMLRGEYEQAFRVAQDGIKALDLCKGANRTSKSMLALNKINCAVKMRDFERGVAEIKAADKWVPTGTINHLKIYEYAIRLGLLTGRYEYAYLELVKVQESQLKQLLTTRLQEFWIIMESYIHMLILAGELVVKPEWKKLTNFRLSTFLNNVPANVRNKRGMNIQVLILQAIILILQGKLDKMIDRTDALDAYCNRYLRNDANLRNNGFFKLLRIVIQSNFRRAAAERKAVKTLKTMRQAEERGDQNDLELVPYEELWRILLNSLD